MAPSTSSLSESESAKVKEFLARDDKLGGLVAEGDSGEKREGDGGEVEVPLVSFGPSLRGETRGLVVEIPAVGESLVCTALGDIGV